MRERNASEASPQTIERSDSPHELGTTTNRNSELGSAVRGRSYSAGVFGRVAGLIRGDQNLTHLFSSGVLKTTSRTPQR